MTWYRPRGPASSADFDVDVRPPLVSAWERTLRVGCFEDGVRVGGDGIIAVSTGGTGLTVLDSRTGATRFEEPRIRKREISRFGYCDGAIVADSGGVGETPRVRIRASVLSTTTWQLREHLIPWIFSLVGTTKAPEGTWFALALGRVRIGLEVCESIPWPDDFGASLADSKHVFGTTRRLRPSQPTLVLRLLDVRTGEVLWRQDGGVGAATARAFGSDFIVTEERRNETDHHAVRSMDDGRELWSTPRSGDSTDNPLPLVSGDRVYLTTKHGVDCRLAHTGEPVWSHSEPPGTYIGNPVGTKGLVWFIARPPYRENSEIVALEKADGKVAWRNELKHGTCTTDLTFIDNAFQWHAGKRIVCAVSGG